MFVQQNGRMNLVLLSQLFLTVLELRRDLLWIHSGSLLKGIICNVIYYRLRPFADPFNDKNIKKIIARIKVYCNTFWPHPRPADDTRLYRIVYKCIHSGIIHRTKTKSKHNAAHQSHRIENLGTDLELLHYWDLGSRKDSPVTFFNGWKVNVG